MPEFEVTRLLDTDTLAARNVFCNAIHRERGPQECASITHLVFPYRGIYLRHVGTQQAAADANHVLFFNADEPYEVSHPVAGGDASLVLVLSEQTFDELVPRSLLDEGATFRFRGQQQRIDPRAQALVAILRHGLQRKAIESLEAESLLLTLVCRSLGPRTSHQPRATYGRQRLVDRVKVLLASDLGRRWTLADIAAQVRGSPVYLTQVFKQIEGIPLYRYHLRLRLARALDLLPRCDDLTTLAFDLGFSSHSHFTAAFRQAYGRSPSEFKHSLW